MKQEKTGKKKRALLLISVLAALLVIAGVVLAILLLPGQQGGQTNSVAQSKLYWNVDRLFYTENSESGLSMREPGTDGLYRIRVAVDGAQDELVVADKKIVNQIDSMEVFGVVTDADGLVVEAVPAKNIATEFAIDYFVRRAEGDTLVINSSMAMNGLEETITITDAVGVYDVTPTAQVVGQSSHCTPLDKVYVYSNAEGAITHVYIVERVEKADIYYRVGYHYEWYEKHTIRVPDENGVYTMLFAKGGQQVELKCKDYDLVNQIDSFDNSEADFAFQFDEDGYIIKILNTAYALTGMEGCYNFDINSLENGVFTATGMFANRVTSYGETFQGTLDESCEIYLVDHGGFAKMIGEPAQLQMGDRIICYTDLEGKPILIFITKRMADGPMYYNITRSYANGETTRTPDEKGYYVFKMAVGGKQVELKTKDKAIASRVDSFSNQCMGLKLNGKIIEEVYDAANVCGWNMIGQGRYVTALAAGIATFTSGSDFDTFTNAILATDCEIYDVTWNNVAMGSKTELRQYDKVTAFRQPGGEVTHIYVTQRYIEDAKIYYNIERKYADGATTRLPDEEGYYVFDMICEGKAVTLKTKDKEIASYIDKQWPNFSALQVKNGIIKQAYKAASAIKYGSSVSPYHYVGEINKADRTFSTYYYEGGQRKEGYGLKTMAKDCVIYNVSAGYTEHRGEKATLKPDDIIQGFNVNPSGEVVQIYILSRKFDSPLYWNTKQMYDWTNRVTTRQPDADGYYVFDLIANGKPVQVKTKSKDTATAIDAKETAFALILDGSEVVRVGGPALAKGIKDAAATFTDVTATSGNKLTVTQVRLNRDNVGEVKELTLAKNCKVYDMSSYANPRGAETTLGLGDRVTCYTNSDDEVVACFITYKNTRQEGHISLCEHCGEEVYWHPYPGTFYTQDAHYYLTHDYYATSQRIIGNTETQYEVVLDLNGHTLTAEKRAFLIYGTLNIMDTVGGGTIAAENGDGSFGGCIMATASGTLNLYSGTLTQTEDATYGRQGGVLNLSGYNTTFNMYGGTVCGGTVAPKDGNAPYGGNIYSAGGTVNLYGGKITGGKIIADGTTAARGCNIYITGNLNLMGGSVDGDIFIANKNATVKLSGAPVVNKGSITGLYLKAGRMLTLQDLTKGASVVITGNGVFAQTQKAADYKAYFKTTYSGDAIVVEGETLSYIPSQRDVDNSDLSFKKGTTRAMCPVCGEEVVWTALTQANYSTTVLQMATHYYLTEDITSNSTDTPVLNVPTWRNAGGEQHDGYPICVHLNGHSITASGYYAISNNYGGATLNMMGNGTVSGNNTTANRAATLFMNTDNNLAMNLYGGTYVKPDGNSNPIACVGIWSSQNVMNIYGDATFDCTHDSDSDGTADVYGSGLTVHNGIVNIAGGKYTGETAINGGTVTLSGAPEVGLMKIAEGVKLTLGNLKPEASVTVIATDVFTEENENTASYAGCFSPAITTDRITSDNNVLTYVGTPKDDVVDNSDLNFLSGTKRAVCPVCDTLVEWVALNQENYAAFRDGAAGTGYLQAGTHYYLEESITSSGVVIKVPTYAQAGGAANDGKHICLHLNGKDITSTGNYAIHNNYGGATLDIMGNGNVSGNTTTAGRASTILVVAENTLALNLYGGTYVKPEANTNPVVGMGLWNTVKSTLNVYTGTVIEGGIALYDGGNLTLTDPDINGEVKVNAGNVTLVGKTTIDRLALADGVKITLKEMKEGASVCVSASGVFTTLNDKTADYFGYFTAASSVSKIVMNEEKTQLQMERDYSQNLRFAESTTTATCPVCDKEVQWVALNQENYAAFRDGTAGTGYLQAGTHYYLEESITSSGIVIKVPTYSQAGGAANDGKHICLHLNGHNITSTGDYAISNNYGGATLDIMGSGTVSGNNTTANRAATLFHNTDNKLAINLYGGTYVKPDTNTNPIINVGIWNYQTVLNIHGDTLIDGSGNTAGGCLVQNNGTITMTGGTIQNGKASHGGNLKLVKGTFNMQGGTISGGTATDTWGLGGNIHISGTEGAAADTVFNMTGGTISGGTAVYGGNINVKNATVTLAGTVTGGQALTNASVSKAYGGNIHVQAGADVTISGTVTKGTATLGGNLRIQAGTVKVTGAVLSEGNATTGKNIYTDGGNLTMTDSTADGSVAIYGGTLTLDGSTQIQGSTRHGNIYIAAAAKLTVKAGFTGIASVNFAGVTDTIPAANGVSEGAFTGTLTLEADGDPAIIGQGTGLVIQTA